MEPRPISSMPHAERTLAPIYLAIGLFALLSPWVFSPAGDGLSIMGVITPDVCGMKSLFGIPCPGCGMTRSWVYASRGDLLTGARFNIAGVLLWFWALWVGLVGAVRIGTRDPNRLKVSDKLLFGWLGTYVSVFWLLPWIARLFGFNPLP